MIKTVKYVSWGGYSGYGIAAKRYMLALIKAGINVNWVPMLPSRAENLWYAPADKPEPHDQAFSHLCKANSDYEIVVVHMVPEYYPNWIEREKKLPLDKRRKIIGCTVWETDKIPKHWVSLLNRVDSLIVPCQWNKDVFINCGVTVPISVIPHVSLPRLEIETIKRESDNHSLERKYSIELNSIPADDFVFYNINSWTVRKAMWLTIESYLNAFTAADPVTLIIKTSLEDFSKPRHWWRKIYTKTDCALSKSAFNKILSKYPNPAKIVFIDSILSEEELSTIHARGDCYVSLARSEGWGLGSFDACAYGNAVIINGHAGCLEYLHADKAYLIDYKLVSVDDRIDPKCYHKEGYWAEPDLSNASKTMQYVFKNQDAAKKRGEALQTLVCDSFSEEKIGIQFLEFLNQRVQK